MWCVYIVGRSGNVNEIMIVFEELSLRVAAVP